MNKIKSLISIFLTLICFIFYFNGCSANNSVAMSYNGYEISEGMYRYWMISWKANFINNYSDVEDTDEYWSSLVSEGSEQTNEEYIKNNIETRIKYYLIGQYLFDLYSLKLDSESKETISGYIDDKIEYYGSRSACNKALESEYGIDLKTLEKIYTFEQKYLTVYDYLYGTSGLMTATSDEIDNYYQNYYVRAKYIIFLKDCKKKYDDDGKLVTDENGYAVYENLTDEEKIVVKKNAEESYNDIKNDVVFEGYNDTADYYMEKYMSEYIDNVLETYPNGFYITADEYAVHTAAVTEAVFDMSDGEVRLVENESCYFVIKKYSLIDKAYSTSIDSGQFSYLVSYANSEKFTNDFTSYAEDITCNEDVTSKYLISEL